MKIIKTVLAAATSLLAAHGAQAAIIDFDEFTHSGSYTFHNPFVSGGFNFVNSSASYSSLGVWGTSYNGWSIDPNGASIFHNHGHTTTTVTKVGGGSFALDSIDLGDVYNDASGGSILLTFTDSNGTTSQTVMLDNLAGGQTFSLNRTGLTAFTMQGVTTRGGWMQFDNVAVDGVAAVPEPSAWAFMILGFGVIGASLRRRATATRFATA